MQLSDIKPTPMLLTEAEVDALLAVFNGKRDEALKSGVAASYSAWDAAAELLHNARIASFDKRSGARRDRKEAQQQRERQQLVTPQQFARKQEIRAAKIR